jgi:hypothetical protein
MPAVVGVQPASAVGDAAFFNGAVVGKVGARSPQVWCTTRLIKEQGCFQDKCTCLHALFPSPRPCPSRLSGQKPLPAADSRLSPESVQGTAPHTVAVVCGVFGASFVRRRMCVCRP